MSKLIVIPMTLPAMLNFAQQPNLIPMDCINDHGSMRDSIIKIPDRRSRWWCYGSYMSYTYTII